MVVFTFFPVGETGIQKMSSSVFNLLSLNGLPIPLLMLYAETHFRFFSSFPSLLFKRQPEVLFDLPYRLEPGNDLPILLIINDNNRFPDVPERVAVAISGNGTGAEVFPANDLTALEVSHPLQPDQRAFIYRIPAHRLPEGEFFVTATVTMRNGGKTYAVINDNLTTSTKRAFRCFNAPESLPGKGLCVYGDLHIHSQFSQSHVEFGPPVRVIDVMAKSCGLSFAGITDHSYDLSCETGDYLKENQSIDRWNLLQEQLGNPSGLSTVLLPGEEVSCLNANGDTVHLGALNITGFIPGSADGARRNLAFRKSLTLTEAIAEIHRQGGIAFAAHPGSRSGLLQRLLLHRGSWSEADMMNELDGIQAFNSGFSPSWERGKVLWLKMLSENRRVPLLAGNDAHGDFNRYRSIKTPFLNIYEDFQRCMGYGKTGIYGNCLSADEIVRNIKNGATFISTGPYISINYSENTDDCAIGNQRPEKPVTELFVHAVTTREFGRLRTLKVFSGYPSSPEKLLFQKEFAVETFESISPISLSDLLSASYVRAEVTARGENGGIHRAYTSACWL